ncbi:MAG TPA: polysaccharide biosynthesis/export family protein [Hyphomicrobiaceae bacterium]|nr:polysaccharide biosynthesis/export family protein [Hyphomicrobiaceae bacterium]
MSRSSRRFVGAVAALAIGSALAGCRHASPWDTELAIAPPDALPAAMPAWGPPLVVAAAEVVEEGDGPYLLDSGDKLRIFVYGHPNLSRLYTVDQQGMVSVPLIGDVPARGRTTRALGRAIAARLGAQYVKDPQVTVDIAQYRPFFILGEVRNAGQYPFVSGMTVQAAVAIAGGYADRADERRVQITRRHRGGIIEKMDVPPDYSVQPGDTIYVYERWL